MILLSFIFLVSCVEKDGGNIESDSGEELMQIYYLDATQTSIVGMDYFPEAGVTGELIEESMDALSLSPQSSAMKKAKPDSVVMQSYQLADDGRLTIDFSLEYNELIGTAEVLCRATIVKTLIQIEGVDRIEFTVNGQPLLDSKEKPVGFMDNESFIHSTNAENVNVTVYFSDETGQALLASNLRITYDGNISIAELILNRLILGPVEDNMQAIIPEGAELNSVTIKDGICYVDFNEEFVNLNPNIDPEIVIYSVVNSLVELSYINKVQFTINGVMVEEYNGIDFNEPFERKLELIDESR